MNSICAICTNEKCELRKASASTKALFCEDYALELRRLATVVDLSKTHDSSKPKSVGLQCLKQFPLSFSQLQSLFFVALILP
jgi:hypothetical protein